MSQIIQNINRETIYPLFMQLTNSTSSVLSFHTDDWSQQMLSELPCIKLTFYKLINQKYVDQKRTVCVDTKKLEGSFILSNIPESLTVGIEPIFDNNAIFSHNCKVANSIEDNLWSTPTQIFNITINLENP